MDVVEAQARMDIARADFSLLKLEQDLMKKSKPRQLAELELKWQGEPGKALERYCHVILNSAAFLYVD